MAVSFLFRLRERRVFRTVGYYVLGAWALLQVGDVIVEPAGLPDWSMTALLYLLLLGVPLAAFLGWRYDITEHGIVRTVGSTDGEVDVEKLKLRFIDYVVVAALVGVIAYVAVRTLPFAQDGSLLDGDGPAMAMESYEPGSIAILPFDDLSRDSDHAYLGDGISDTITHVLSQVDGIRVTARTSAFSFKGRQLQIREIGESLGVAHVLEGSVQREKDEVRVIARLINTTDDSEVWSGYYDRDLASLFDIQDEIAQEVTTALKVTVLGGDDAELVAGYQPDLAAFEQLILGREALDRETTTGAQEAYERFEKAIAIDPDYALAYTLLSRAVLRRVSMPQRTDALLARAGELTRKALDLDPLLPEANVDVAQQKMGMKDFEGAELAAQRALEARPSFAAAYSTLALIYRVQNRFEDALAMARRAAELDPQENDYQRGLAIALWNTARAEAAVGQMRKAIRRSPAIPTNYAVIARYLAQMGRSGEALYWTNRALQLDPDNPDRQRDYCLGLLQLWAVDRATQCFREVVQAQPQDTEAAHYLAVLTDDLERGLANARKMVEASANSWYKKMQLAEWLNVAGEHEQVIALLRGAFPGLYATPPAVNDMTVWAARTLAVAYQGAGLADQARTLIDAGLEHIDMTRKLQSAFYTTGADDVFYLALDGAYTEAVERLREAIDRDWQFFSFGLLFAEHMGVPEAFLADARFLEQRERQCAIMAEELAWYDTNRDEDLLSAR